MKVLGWKVGKYKDGGPESPVTGYMAEHKRLFTFGLLHFGVGMREAFHTHAFDCVSVVLTGSLREEMFYPEEFRVHNAGSVIVTRRSDLHRVCAPSGALVLTLRGPWSKSWHEVVSTRIGFQVTTLSHGRVPSEETTRDTKDAAAELVNRTVQS